jgi:hypothetical protein
MATQAQTKNQPLSSFDYAVFTLFSPTAAARQIDAAAHRLLDSVEQNGSLKASAQAHLLRAYQYGKLDRPGVRSRYDRVIRPQLKRPAANNNDKPLVERKCAPPEAKKRKHAQAERDRDYRAKHRGSGGGDSGKVLRAVNPRTIRKNERRKARSNVKK